MSLYVVNHDGKVKAACCEGARSEGPNRSYEISQTG